MRLRAKLLLAQAPMALALLVTAALAIRTAVDLGRAPGAIHFDNFRSFDAANAMLAELDALDREATRSLLEGRALEADAVAASVAAFERELALQEANITEVGEDAATRELRAAWQACSAGATAPIAGADGLREQTERSLRVRRAVGTILELNRDAIRRRSAAAGDRAAETSAVLLLATLLALLAGFAISAWSLRMALAPLRVLTRGVRGLAAGDFGGRIRLRGRDELGELAAAFNDMADKLAAYRESTLGDLLVANSRLEAVMASLGEAVIVYDLRGEPLLANLAARRLFGQAADLRVANLPEGVREVAAEAFERARREGEPVEAASLEHAVEVPSRDGPRWVVVGANPVRGPGEQLDGITLSLRDVTRQRRIEGFRGDLVAAAAHELRTPLTSLHLAVHLCLEEAAGPLTEKQKDLLDAARRDCERLQREVEELLEMARLESGTVRLQRVRVAAAALCRDAVQRQEAAGMQAGSEVVAVPGDALLTVESDPERVRHVLDNLVDNALKHAGGRGRIEVGFEAAEATEARASAGSGGESGDRREQVERGEQRERGEQVERGGAVRFYVDDAGPGIPEELRERVFTKFFRVPGTERPGAGIGLAIVRDIVRAHGGEVGVGRSARGGARFWFTLPCRGPKGDQAEPSDAAAEPPAGGAAPVSGGSLSTASPSVS